MRTCGLKTIDFIIKTRISKKVFFVKEKYLTIGVLSDSIFKVIVK